MDADIRHLRSFMADHHKSAGSGYLVCRCERPLQLDDNITAVPWWMV